MLAFYSHAAIKRSGAMTQVLILLLIPPRGWNLTDPKYKRGGSSDRKDQSVRIAEWEVLLRPLGEQEAFTVTP